VIVALREVIVEEICQLVLPYGTAAILEK